MFYFFKKSKFLIFVTLFLIISHKIFAQEVNFSIKKPLTEDLSRTHGFLVGQRCSIKKIKSIFPHLKASSEQALSEFKITFGVAETNIKAKLKEFLGSNYAKYISEHIKPACNKLQNQNIDFNSASSYISDIKNRSQGNNIPSPVLETLLTYQYKNAPEKEFYAGFIKSFSTKGHIKSQGLEIVLSYPISWKEKEEIRPHTIRSFISENGRGLANFNIVVKKIPQPITSDEISLFFTEEEMKEILPSYCKYVSFKKIVLDRFEGGMVTGNCIMKRLDLSLKTTIQFYIAIIDNKMLTLTFTVPNETKKELQKFQPLFYQIANSLVIQNQYY